MSDEQNSGAEKADYKDTVFLPKTDFPMRAGLAQKEPKILAKWQADDLYGQLRKERAGRERYILHDGPPYANGDIHMGHAMNKVLKDIIVRAHTLTGKDAPYIPGWDCHGLPIEWKIEEAYRKKKKNKDEVPPREFRQECRDYAAKWVGVQREQFERLGVMGDWDDPYLTMKFESEARIVEELMKFAASGQLYRGAKPVMWSPVEKTALAEAEVEYEDITSTQIDVAFEITKAPNAPELVGAHAVIWTTTPWTIPVNQALAYGADVEYVTVWSRFERGLWAGCKFVVAKELLGQFVNRLDRIIKAQFAVDFPDESVPEILFENTPAFKGSDLAGALAKHPMADAFPDSEFYTKPRPFLDGSSFVTTDAGTGLVHMAPDHGEDDFLLCKANGINPVFAVDGDGLYREDWPWLPRTDERSRSVINKNFVASDGPICSDLREAGALLSASDDFQHSYPHSWRSKAKIIFRCTPQWFIPMDKDSVSASGQKANASTLRQKALASIEETRWVPAKAENRIRSMVEGRPDWVISRQRAWGVPIALYVSRKSGEYLVDEGVNERILAAFRESGADAWFDADHQALLGSDYDLADYEPVNDILDVWFDSGSTHAFVLEERYGEGTRADLYIEGSDQHRGWFQSSLLEASGTRGRAPYDAVLTHGFALDGEGRKMSKSQGNVVDPLKIIGESGADILRMWVASTDYFDDVRIGKQVLGGTSDSYRKLRNSFRYMLGALADFDPSEAVAPDAMPELERYVLHLLAELDAKLKASVHDLTFNRYIRALVDFCNEDLSAFYFDIRKDCLYCDVNLATGEQTEKRAAARTVLHTLFEALVRYAAPIIPFTAEEIWQTRYPDSPSVHLLEWPEATGKQDAALAERWQVLRDLRDRVNEAIEPMRREKAIRSSLEAEVTLAVPEAVADVSDDLLAELFISSTVHRDVGSEAPTVKPTDHHKCGRCWRLLPEVSADGALCGRCADILHEDQAGADA